MMASSVVWRRDPSSRAARPANTAAACQLETTLAIILHLHGEAGARPGRQRQWTRRIVEAGLRSIIWKSTSDAINVSSMCS